MAFFETLKTLPSISHLSQLQLIDGVSGDVIHSIENKAGQIGSLTVYSYLAKTFGAITPEAAQRGLELYGEHTEDARLNPGKHPNIDRLFALVASGASLKVTEVPADGA